MPSDYKKTLRQITHNLAIELRNKIFEKWGDKNLRKICGDAVTGDFTFKIDEIAEEHLEIFINKSKFPIAYFSEDKGLIIPKGNPDFMLIVDPVDGTRAAIAGLESCCVSVAAAPLDKNAKLRDVTAASLAEIKSGNILTGIIGNVPEYFNKDGLKLSYSKSVRKEINGMLWGFEFAGRPAKYIIKILEGLIDKSSLSGGCFVLNSSSFSILNVCLGKFDCYMDPWGYFVQINKETEDETRRNFEGKMGYLHSYDIAAAVPLAESTGCIVSDIKGNSLGDWFLINEKNEMHRSCVCSSNLDLHEKILKYFINNLS